MYKHYTKDNPQQEVTTEDGKYKYWRIGPPMPMETGLLVKRYQCGCGRKFPGEVSYELHWRKAYEEEKHVASTPPKSNNEEPSK